MYGLVIKLLVFVLICAIPVVAQSGRVKKKEENKDDKKPKTASYNPTQKVNPKATPTVTPDPNAPPGTPPEIGRDDISIDSTLVPIPVSVFDIAAGRALTTLQLSDFTLKIDGKSALISEIFRSESPVRLALLFDNSSSVTTAREFEQKAAIRFFRRVIRPELDLAALYSVAGVTQLEQPLTKNIGLLISAIESFPPPEGATALHDGIIEASNYLEDHAGRRVIVIVSDGQDTLSDYSFDKMVEAVQKTNCQVYIVHTNEFENFKRTGRRSGSANLRALAAERRMRDLAKQTGGAVYSPIDEEELDTAFAQISAELSSQYILGYYPEDEDRDGRFRRIDLTVNSERRLTVRARSGYFAGDARKDRN
ncbi:MAG: VWA domain-containing protein [Acidobacteriota bacterium]|nr:VWA domain-containing protein [Acidobacteriota bacterium]MDH3530918.1 VWA domain-containing protein [Acidobacteriota bacterium]